MFGAFFGLVYSNVIDCNRTARNIEPAQQPATKDITRPQEPDVAHGSRRARGVEAGKKYRNAL